MKGWTGSLDAVSATTDTAGASQDRLLFTTDPSSVSGFNLSQITFHGDNGVQLGSGARLVSYNGMTEIVPIPEPRAAVLLTAGLGF